jgi:hypothetical protein
MSGLSRFFAGTCVRIGYRRSEIVSGVEERLRQLPHAENDPPRRTYEIYRPRDPRGKGRGSLSGLGPDKDAIQMREYCVAKGAMHRANRLDPSLREVRLLRMTIKLWGSAGLRLAELRLACRSPSGSIMLDLLEAAILRFRRGSPLAHPCIPRIPCLLKPRC